MNYTTQRALELLEGSLSKGDGNCNNISFTKKFYDKYILLPDFLQGLFKLGIQSINFRIKENDHCTYYDFVVSKDRDIVYDT